jgi:hypothetical protein
MAEEVQNAPDEAADEKRRRFGHGGLSCVVILLITDDSHVE